MMGSSRGGLFFICAALRCVAQQPILFATCSLYFQHSLERLVGIFEPDIKLLILTVIELIVIVYVYIHSAT